MSFTGDLEHLPIVDVIQLLDSTRKTGTLCVRGRTGECRLVFREGNLVSAGHLHESTKIGKVLADMGLVSRNDLDKALDERNNGGPAQKPLIAILNEQGFIEGDGARKGLEAFIGMTIVEVLTWSGGTFALDISASALSDEYRYLAEVLQQEIALSAQGVLMDALRIYDEKTHDGTLGDLLHANDAGEEEAAPEGEPDDQAITADLLGLDAIDSLEKKVPEVFRGLRDHNPADEHRQVIRKELPDLPSEEQEQLCTFLTKRSRSASSEVSGSAVILFSQNAFIAHAITTTCNHEGFFVLTTDDEASLDIIIEQSLARDLHPVLIIDVQHASAREAVLALARQKHAAYPQISILLMGCEHRDYEFTLQALEAGVRAQFPSPCPQEPNGAFTSGTISLLTTLGSYLKRFFTAPEWQIEREFKACFELLSTVKEPPEAALILLRFAATMFERALTLVVGKNELVAERGIGIMGDKSVGPTRPLMFKIPLEGPSVFQEVITSGQRYYAQCTDQPLINGLYKEIGPPHCSKILLVPLKSNGRVIALFYADFGAKAVSPLHTDFFFILAQHAGLILDNALLHKKV